MGILTMFLKEFNQSASDKIKRTNKFLKEEFNLSITAFPTHRKLLKIKESAESAIIKLKSASKPFHMNPEYAKFLGIKDVVETMINEGYYAESPKYMEMKDMITASVQELMDSGYTMDEACNECMNRFRMDNRFAYDDEHVLPIVIKASKDYMEACSGMVNASIEEDSVSPQTDLNEYLLRELAKECGVEINGVESYDAIEEKLNMFAEVTGKSRDSIVGFLNGLEEDAVGNGIKMFGAKVAEANAFVKARKDAIAKGEKKFTVGGKEFDVTGDTSDEVEESSMFDDIIGEMINEEVDVEQAEVVMAVRAVADDVQDQIEEIGRMMNETVPAIADQMRGEMGAEAAASFNDSMQQVLATYIESAKAAKAGIDQAVALTSGGEQVGGLGDTGELGMAEPTAELGAEEPAVDVNEPAAAGPEEEPLGRAEVEL